MEKREVIVLDLGGVIMDHDAQAKRALAIWRKADGNEALSQQRKRLLHQYGCGQISTEQFLSDTGLSIEQWNSIHAGIPAERMAYLRQLAEHYPLYLLSNNDELHWQHVLELYPELPGLFRQLVLSHRVGIEKPDRRIYEYTQQLIEREQGEEVKIVFVDDSAENRAAAEEVGWRLGVEKLKVERLEA